MLTLRGCCCEGGTSEPICTEEVTRIGTHSSGRQDDATTVIARNSSISKISTGRYRVVFDDAHPDGLNYEVLFGNTVDGNRDGRDIQVIDGTQTATGFDVWTTVGDNGTAADGVANTDWSYSVPMEEVVRQIVDCP
ncbi:hypothetical protein N9043_01070 [bacterium]|nr:hypothetical protein [bacterium]